MQDMPITPRKNFFELGANRVAGMRGWDTDKFRRVRQKDRAPREKSGTLLRSLDNKARSTWVPNSCRQAAQARRGAR